METSSVFLLLLRFSIFLSISATRLRALQKGDLGITHAGYTEAYHSVSPELTRATAEATTGETTNDQCTCRAEWPSLVTCTDYVEPQFLRRLEKAEVEIAILRQQLSEYNQTVVELHIELESVGSSLNTTQETLEGVLDGTIVISVSEVEVIHRELKEMSSSLEQIGSAVQDVPEVQELQEEVANLTKIIQDLKLSNPNEVRILRHQLENLKAKLAKCEQAYTEDQRDRLFQPWASSASQDSCGDLVQVSEPFTVRGRGTRSGAWFRDPVLDYEKVWYAPFRNSRFTYQVDRFSNVADFTRGTNYESRFILPTGSPSQGPGMVAYNGSLYYHEKGSNRVIRYQADSNAVVAAREIPDALVDNDGAYASMGYTDIDLAVDEYGLWVIYTPSSNGDRIAVGELDPQTLDITATKMASFSKFTAGNCFMICAKLYCVNNHFSNDASVNFVYDTKTAVSRELQVPFDNRFSEMMSLDYNPHDQKLYGWDNGHQVVYDLTFDSVDTRSESHPTMPYRPTTPLFRDVLH
ncbi:noelin-2-like [Diadema antillarum]|uniref:noelin-2-like n=1 Tax=Diadema antillarum TaxID=105358 RepID=UPI003A8B8794